MIVGRWLERRNKRRYIFLHSTTVSGYSSIKYCNWAVASPDQYSFSLSLVSLWRELTFFFWYRHVFLKCFYHSLWVSVCRRARFDCGYLPQIRTEMSVTRSLLGRVSLYIYIYVNVKRLYVHFLSIQIRFVTNFLHPRIEYN